MLLSHIAAELELPLHGEDVRVLGVSSDSRAVSEGDLFVAVPGARHDGVRFVPDAIAAGARAVCATTPIPGLPTMVAPDPRAVLGRLSAAVYGHPSRQVAVIGVTGTLGKTSTALTLAHTLSLSGSPAGVIGSLGVEIPGIAEWETNLTTPEAPVIQRALLEMERRATTHAIMEVSSHSLLLGRVEGVELAMGLFLNLVPDEHLEFHPSPEHYLSTKLRFLELLRPHAPLVHNGDDSLTMGAIARDEVQRPGAERIGVSSHESADAAIWVRVEPRGISGSLLILDIRRELPLLDGGSLQRGALELHFPLLGRQLAWNATIAATAAMILGVAPDAIARAFPSQPPIPRRMEVLEAGTTLILDDTAGNPRSILAVLETIRSIPHRRARVVYAVRGARGTAINRQNGAAIATLASALSAELVISDAEDHADGRNRVTREERDVVLTAVRDAGIPCRHEPNLEAAIRYALDGVEGGDMVLLLGAQGMDAGAAIARRVLGERGSAAPLDTGSGEVPSARAGDVP